MPCILFDRHPAMYEWKKHIDPNNGMPEHWAKLLRKTHEVSCRIAKAIRRTIDHTDGPDGAAHFRNPSVDRETGFDGNMDGLRQEL